MPNVIWIIVSIVIVTVTWWTWFNKPNDKELKTGLNVKGAEKARGRRGQPADCEQVTKDSCFACQLSKYAKHCKDFKGEQIFKLEGCKNNPEGNKMFIHKAWYWTFYENPNLAPDGCYNWHDKQRVDVTETVRKPWNSVFGGAGCHDAESCVTPFGAVNSWLDTVVGDPAENCDKSLHIEYDCKH